MVPFFFEIILFFSNESSSKKLMTINYFTLYFNQKRKEKLQKIYIVLKPILKSVEILYKISV